MAKKEKRPQYQTPKGEFQYPHLNRPDTREFDDGTTSKPAFKVNLLLEGEVADKLKAFLNEQVDESFAEAKAELIASKDGKKVAKAKKMEKAYPYDAEVDAAGNETGRTIFKFKQNAEIKLRDGTIKAITIPVFDAKGKPLDLKTVKIGGGTVGYLAYSMRKYFMNATDKAGVTLDLQAAQIVTLVEYAGKSATSYGFNTDEDGFSADESAPDATEVGGDETVDGEDF